MKILWFYQILLRSKLIFQTKFSWSSFQPCPVAVMSFTGSSFMALFRSAKISNLERFIFLAKVSSLVHSELLCVFIEMLELP